MLLQLLLSPKNTSCLDDSSGDKSGTSIHLPAGTKDSSGGQRRPLLTAYCLLRAFASGVVYTKLQAALKNL